MIWIQNQEISSYYSQDNWPLTLSLTGTFRDGAVPANHRNEPHMLKNHHSDWICDESERWSLVAYFPSSAFFFFMTITLVWEDAVALMELMKGKWSDIVIKQLRWGSEVGKPQSILLKYRLQKICRRITSAYKSSVSSVRWMRHLWMELQQWVREAHEWFWMGRKHFNWDTKWLKPALNQMTFQAISLSQTNFWYVRIKSWQFSSSCGKFLSSRWFSVMWS